MSDMIKNADIHGWQNILSFSIKYTIILNFIILIELDLFKFSSLHYESSVIRIITQYYTI